MGRKPPEYRIAVSGGDGGGGGGVGSLLCLYPPPPLFFPSLIPSYIRFLPASQSCLSSRRNMFFENHEHPRKLPASDFARRSRAQGAFASLTLHR